MSETAHHILTAERRVTQLQEQQLAWAETSPEAAGALRAARTRAVLHVASRLNAGVGTLHDLRVVMSELWSVQVERAGMLGARAEEWDKENCCVDGYDPNCDTEDLVYILEELWPDVVVETDAWTRRMLGDAE
ncbi:hypothetical protein D2E70_16230 [Mycobacteroides abscessus]|uniref:hypothetical protein n=1 Tax=Mycobacteroides abscessus TaxID=36809 RepID=UPI000E6A1B48|nr:hypothetical protein [Mycobacteroides abscessus]RIS02751.1 hypothetical protein D2E45_12280 [Mycobacteroides abscessus]RIS67519.1 hypothetical protein D2E70_16230 [Mycobacteroides abscessus]